MTTITSIKRYLKSVPMALSLLAWATTVLAHQGAETTDSSATQPNIILMMADDLGWGDVGFNGGRSIKTPQLDAMAANGLRFQRFYAASAVCSPTRGSLITGRNPYRYGVYYANKGHMRAPELTLAELLRERGYNTGHFGKWHLGTMSKTVKEGNRGGVEGAHLYSPPWENGFNTAFSTEAKVPTWDPMLKPVDADKLGWNYIKDKSTATPYGTHYWNEQGEIVTDNLQGDDSRVIVDRLLPFIQQSVANKQPFFAVVWFHTPHLPVVAGPKYAAMYANAPSDYQRNYYGAISAMDEQIGRVRKLLQQLNINDNTLLAFTSDNGPEGKAGQGAGSAGPFRGRKRDLYEGGLRVPSLIEWPKQITPATASNAFASTSDYLPTIIDILGIDTDNRPLDGVSLMPLLTGQITTAQQFQRKPIGFLMPGKAAWVEGRYKLIKRSQFKMTLPKKLQADHNMPLEVVGKGSYELYDLQQDPYEQHNLASSQAKRVAAMDKALSAWITSCRHSDAGADYP